MAYQEQQPDMDHPLLKKSKLQTLSTVTKFVVAIEITVFFLWMIMSIMDSGVSGSPFFLPIQSFLFIMWLMLLVVNISLMALHGLRIKWTDNEKESLWHINDYGTGAWAVIIICIVLIIIFGYPPLMEAVEGQMKNTEEETGITDYSYRFSSGDALNVSQAYKVTVVSTNGQLFNVSIVTLESQEEFPDFSGPKLSTANNRDRYSYEEKLDHGDYFLYITSEDDANVRYTIEKRIEPSILTYFLWFPIILMAANIGWAVALFAARQSKIKKFITKEQAKRQKTFTIEEVFLIYQDGRLIAHNTRRLKADVDKDILTGMLTAVQNFVAESFQKDEAGVLDEMHYGNLNILIENGPYANMAVVVHGEEPKDVRRKMKDILAEIHQTYGPYLADWDGDTTALHDTKRAIGEITPPAPPHKTQSYVEEAFLFHRDGRFIYHVTQRYGPDVDDELLKDTVHYIEERVGPCLNAMPQSLAQSIPYGDWNIMLEYERDIYLAALLSGPEPRDFRQVMQNILGEIQAAHGQALYNWDGSMEGLTDLRKILDSLFIRMELKGKKGRWGK
jgi:hypothetical protein